MNQLYQKIRENLQCLPPKDKELCEKFLEKKDFISLREIVDSCIYMKKKDLKRNVHREKWTGIDLGKLEELDIDILDYTSCLDIPDNDC